MSRGTRHRQRDAVRFFCPTLSGRTRPPDPFRDPCYPGRIDRAGTSLARRIHGRSDSERGNHSKAREVQRPQGQHDDLACLPRARSRQGSHRRSAASRNGGRPSLRHASRVVAAASGARTSRPVARDSNRVSVGHKRRRQETGFRGPETNAPKRPPKSDRSFAETKRPQQAPPIRGRSPLAGKSPRTRECVVDQPEPNWALDSKGNSASARWRLRRNTDQERQCLGAEYIPFATGRPLTVGYLKDASGALNVWAALPRCHVFIAE
jgi:hypothetical protein